MKMSVANDCKIENFYAMRTCDGAINGICYW